MTEYIITTNISKKIIKQNESDHNKITMTNDNLIATYDNLSANNQWANN